MVYKVRNISLKSKRIGGTLSKLERKCKEEVVPNLRYHTGISMERSRKQTNSLSIIGVAAEV
jgi:hypothetical protein